MKAIVIAGLVGISFGVVRPSLVWDTYRQLYPEDPAERRALNECFTQDPQFNRLDPAARAACFRHSAPMLGASETAPAAAPSSNFVDLWRASGQGSMPQNDIRSQQANYRFFHPTNVAPAR